MLLEAPSSLLLDGFPRIVVVNLPERTDRRREMEQQLRAVGSEPCDPRIRFFAAARPREVGDWPGIGARGCFQSHLEILREAAADGLESILILEDDCDFTPRPTSMRAALIEQLADREWEMCIRDRPTPRPKRPCSEG